MTDAVDITTFGASEPEYLLAGWTDAEAAVAKARAAYIAGVVEIEEFEQALDRAYGLSDQNGCYRR